MNMKLIPAVPCTDPAFRYTPSHQTDLRKKFRQLTKAMQSVRPQTKPKELT